MPTHFHKKPNQYVSHVQIKVSNLKNSLDYYQSIIGFSVLEQTETTAVLTTDGKTSILSLEEVPNALPLRNGLTGLYHFAILLPTRKDLGNIVQHFIQHNVRIGAGDHFVSEALYLNDPDGNGIEIYVDRPESTWTWNGDYVDMGTVQLDFQPILAEADGQWNGLPEGTVMGHIHLSVADLKETEDFYANILGFDVVTRYGNQALFISTGKYHHHIGLNTWHSANGVKAADNNVGLKSFTIVLNDDQRAEQIKENLQKAGAKVEQFSGASNYGGRQVFSTEDPSGIRIVFTVEGE